MDTEKHYFVSYFYKKSNGWGFGNSSVTVKDGVFDITGVSIIIKLDNPIFNSVIILSFQEIDKNQM